MIDKDAFVGCNRLTTLSLPSSLQQLSRQSFEKCTSLETIEFCGTTDVLGTISIREGQTLVVGQDYNGYTFASVQVSVGQPKCKFEDNGKDNDNEYDFSQFKTSQDKLVLGISHQPDTFTQAKNVVDLQLSGHTHGGQLFPMGIIQSLASDTLVSGSREIGDFTAITSSGIAGWRYPIKTGARSEYVVINVK